MHDKNGRGIARGLAILAVAAVAVAGGIALAADAPSPVPTLKQGQIMGVVDERGNPIYCADGKPLQVPIPGPPTHRPAPPSAQDAAQIAVLEEQGAESTEEVESKSSKPRCDD